MTSALAAILLVAFVGLGALAWRTRGFLAGLIALVGTVIAAGLLAASALAGAGRTATTAVELLAAFAVIGVVLLGLAALANRLLDDGEPAED